MFGAMTRSWKGASTAARGALLAGVLAVLVLFGVGAFRLTQQDYDVLFADLNAQDAASMVKELDRMKVPYRLSDEGATILVERALVYKTRLGLMGKGLDLHGAVGFEIFNEADFGMTEFAQKVNFQRALQGELARTIMAFDEIRQARVHLVLPETGLFKRQSAQPKASVSLLMKGDAALAADRISGIQRLVAASVPGIRPEDVTIVDHRGVALSRSLPTGDSDVGVPARWEAKQKVEEYLARKIVAVLDRAVGPGKAIVSVDASINYDQLKVTREDVVPAGSDMQGALVRRRESRQGAGSLDLLTGSQGSNEGGSVPGPVSSTTELEFLNGRRVEQAVYAPGGIHRLSVGVLVPEVSDPVELAKLREMVAMAAGINSSRGDALAVYHVTVPAQGTNAIEGERLDAQPLDGQEAFAAGGDVRNDLHDIPRRGSVHPEVPDWALPALLLVAAVAVLACAVRVRRLTPRRLSPDARARMLAEISDWASGPRT